MMDIVDQRGVEFAEELGNTFTEASEEDIAMLKKISDELVDEWADKVSTDNRMDADDRLWIPESSAGDSSAAAPARSELDLDQFLPYRLNKLADRISNELEQMYSQHYGLNVAQWRVLSWLSHCDDLTAKKICAYTNMDKARVSRAIQALEDRGLITRSPSPRDQRVHDLHLTQEGSRLLEGLIPDAHAWEAELVSTLSASEYRDLLNAMSKLERQLERIR